MDATPARTRKVATARDGARAMPVWCQSRDCAIWYLGRYPSEHTSAMSSHRSRTPMLSSNSLSPLTWPYVPNSALLRSAYTFYLMGKVGCTAGVVGQTNPPPSVYRSLLSRRHMRSRHLAFSSRLIRTIIQKFTTSYLSPCLRSISTLTFTPLPTLTSSARGQQSHMYGHFQRTQTLPV